MGLYPAVRGRYEVSKKILIVEDEADIRAALVAWFEEEGFETTESDNGIGGLLEYERSQPAIALLYMDMPGMNGVELCSRIRALSPIPLVMFTVAADVGKVEAAIEEGATDWILKHNGFDALIDRITEHLNVERRSICEADFDQGVAAQILTTPERDMSSAGHRIDIDQVGEFEPIHPPRTICGRGVVSILGSGKAQNCGPKMGVMQGDSVGVLKYFDRTVCIWAL